MKVSGVLFCVSARISTSYTFRWRSGFLVEIIFSAKLYWYITTCRRNIFLWISSEKCLRLALNLRYHCFPLCLKQTY